MTPALALAASLPSVITAADTPDLIALLDDDVRWGGDEDTEQTCHSAADVSQSLAAIFESHQSPAVIAATVVDDRVLLELQLAAQDDNEPETEPESLFLVLTVTGGKIVDIRPAADRADGMRRLQPDLGDIQRTQVEVLSVPECPNLPAAVGLVEQTAMELSVPIVLTVRTIKDAEQAQRHRFLGSPTVQVAGIDVDPSAVQRSDYGVSCRVYSGSTGLTGTPPAPWVVQALETNRPQHRE